MESEQQVAAKAITAFPLVSRVSFASSSSFVTRSSVADARLMKIFLSLGPCSPVEFFCIWNSWAAKAIRFEHHSRNAHFEIAFHVQPKWNAQLWGSNVSVQEQKLHHELNAISSLRRWQRNSTKLLIHVEIKLAHFVKILSGKLNSIWLQLAIFVAQAEGGNLVEASTRPRVRLKGHENFSILSPSLPNCLNQC